MTEQKPIINYMSARPRRGADWPYILPFAVFMLFTFAGGQWKDFYPLSYALKTFAVAGILFYCWRYYTRVQWTHLRLGALVGIAGVVQWVGMETLFMSHDAFRFTRMTGDIAAGAFRPYEFFKDSPVLLIGFYIVRVLGASLLVPVMEELFWRDYLWRSIASPNDFRLHGVGEYDHNAFWIVPIAFATVHPQWLTSIVWALMIAWLLVQTRSLGACIVAHGVTNLLLGAYVLFNWYALNRDVWFFW
jgi:uncharacterized protein